MSSSLNRYIVTQEGLASCGSMFRHQRNPRNPWLKPFPGELPNEPTFMDRGFKIPDLRGETRMDTNSHESKITKRSHCKTRPTKYFCAPLVRREDGSTPSSTWHNFTKRSHRSALCSVVSGSKFRHQRYPRNPRLNEICQTNPFLSL